MRGGSNDRQHGQRKRRRGQDAEQVRARGHEGMEHGAQVEVVPHVGLQAGGAVRAQDEPDFQGAETPAERDLPVAVIGYQA